MRFDGLQAGHPRHPGLWSLTIGSLLVLVSRVLALPATLWESDEVLFAHAVLRFEPQHHHPHPPGYPLFVGLGKAINVLLNDPFVSLVVLSVISSVVAFVALTSLFEKCFEDAAAVSSDPAHIVPWGLAVVGALFFFLSPAMLVHSTLPLSDPPALALLALALCASAGARGEATPVRAAAVGVLFSAAVGCRPQLAVAVLPAFAVVLAQMAGWKRRAISSGAFALASLAWLAPLAIVLGGPGKLVAWEVGQVNVLTGHDAALSRGGWSWAEIVLRFVAHPWGPKWLALPMLGAAIIGGVLLVRRRVTRALPLAVLALVQLAFCIALLDPVDGVRYALPSLPAVALAAAVGLEGLAARSKVILLPVLVLAGYACGSAVYVLPLLGERAGSPSPPVQAVRFAAGSFPAGTVILFESSLRTHAELFPETFTRVALDEGWARLPGQSAGPFYLFADRRVAGHGAAVFEWPDSDAYGKLTRNHYRVVSLAPVSRYTLYRPVRGFFLIERDGAGVEWRWVGPDAALQLTNFGCGELRLTLGFDKEAPFPSNTVEVRLEGRPAGQLAIPRGGVRSLEIPIAAGDVAEVTLRSERSYIPAEHGINRDARRLAMQVIAVEQRCP